MAVQTERREAARVTALIIEDDPIIASLLCEMLARLGIEGESCLDPAEGVKRAISGAYAFVSTDMAMPKLHGREVVRSIRQARPELPVFVISGYLDEESVADLQRQGVTDFIHKPFTFRDIKRQFAAHARAEG